MSPLAEPPGLVNMIRLAALKDINGGEQVQEWLDSHYPDPAVVALLADYVADKWGTLDQSWWTARFVPGDQCRRVDGRVGVCDRRIGVTGRPR